ncbi:hypothetical protein ACQPZJ_31850 [Actinoplanes sp. CA-054009]
MEPLAEAAVRRQRGGQVGIAAALLRRQGRSEVDQGRRVGLGDVEQPGGDVVGDAGRPSPKQLAARLLVKGP